MSDVQVQFIIPTTAALVSIFAWARSPRFRAIVRETLFHPSQNSTIVTRGKTVTVFRGRGGPLVRDPFWLWFMRGYLLAHLTVLLLVIPS